MPSHDALLDIQEAAQFLNVSETSLRRWTNAGGLSCLRVGRRRERRFRRADLLAFMEHQPAQRGAAAPRAASVAGHRTRVDHTGVAYGAHLCGLYHTEAGRAKLAATFLDGGLRPRNACVLLASPRARRGILARLQARRPSLESDIRSGRLTIGEHKPTPREQFRFYEDCLGAALRAGARSLRIVGDMWELAEQVGRVGLLDFELGFQHAIAEHYPVITLCIYDVRRFAGGDVVEVLRNHPDALSYPPNLLLA